MSNLPSLEQLHAIGAKQQPSYDDPAALAAAVTRLRTLPPLVFAGECDELKSKVAAASRGEAFLLWGGDCAETFVDATADNTRNKLRVLLQMAVVLTYAASVPVVKVGRLAGQYAKPRSSDSETRDGVTLPAYRGDAVNGFDFTPDSRRHDPQRLLDVYHSSASTLNLVRAFTTGGYADLRQVHTWNSEFVRNSPVGQHYEAMAAEIDRALNFMQAIGADPDEFHRVDFYSSHEALLLEYEHAMTRIDSRTEAPYNVSGHMVWIGERTRQLDGAHVEYFSHIRNPIGCKLGPSATADDALSLAAKLNPTNEPGRLTFITRFGAGKIRDGLPALVEKVTAEGVDVAWVCDAMHGNTFEASNGYKTRRFEDVIDEVQGFFDVHRALDTVPAGILVENTGDDVTEIIGGGEELDELGLAHRYESVVDPRLNRVQSLELSFLVAEMLRKA
ncbi:MULTISPECIES: class II 3-deoxy-7-phosphoheptulonate synthase [unclassified Nocardioides]|uniref:class II 3-deoxy-7-phosphoheptulonate synthase n=1 Tax=unclassified Nocardioides TaxID=2615069 RepID=UPI0006F23E21|nr:MULTISPECIES: 3-deoxy-7-phosphoheptulonate synthase class II [unclassified Nocardioides]KRA37396.1 phospho-2-dehydro-3-deoxyheptonate aldolase [Nocardioides sp. Root614]KRA91357.1 phospho-2-dehydro-3-deoxyheptonate aldolase [Nocardioides sp. Root682]